MKEEQLFNDRLHKFYDELKWLYCEFYQNEENPMEKFECVVKDLKEQYKVREAYLKELDFSRFNDKNWYKVQNFIGMMMYVEYFSNNLKGFEKRLPYLQESNINYIHLKSQTKLKIKNNKKKNENYFEEKFGKISDLEKLTKKCHKNNISIGWDFVLKDFNEINADEFRIMVNNLLNLANWGIDIIHLENLQIQKDECLENKQHNLLRMLRIITEIVCPAVLFAGNIDTAIDKNVRAYFGSKEKPQLHILSNQIMKNTLWHTVATRDVALLKYEVDQYEAIAKENIWQNFIHDESTIQWNLNYKFLQTKGINENMHKEFLNEFFTGKFTGSFSCGLMQDNGICGTTASLCGIEYFDKQKKQKENIAKAINLDLLIHGFLLTLTGIPMLYSGDEIAQYNNYDYQADKHKKEDNQYVHRSMFNWRKAGRRKINNAIQSKIYQGINKLEKLRSVYKVFGLTSKCYTVDTWSKNILAIVRETDTEKLIALYNFSEQEDTAWIDEKNTVYKNLLTKEKDVKVSGIKLPAYNMMWLWRNK